MEGGVIYLYITLALGFIPALLLGRANKVVFREINHLKPFVWLLVFASLYEYFGINVLRLNLFYWFRTYLLLEFLALFYFFFHLLERQLKWLFYFFLALFLGVFIFFLSYNIKMDELDIESWLSLIEIIFVYVFSFLWFKGLFNTMEVDSLWKSPAFYFVSGLIIYFSGTFFLFLMSSSLQAKGFISFVRYWTAITIAMNFILRSFIIIGIWKGRKK